MDYKLQMHVSFSFTTLPHSCGSCYC